MSLERKYLSFLIHAGFSGSPRQAALTPSQSVPPGVCSTGGAPAAAATSTPRMQPMPNLTDEEVRKGVSKTVAALHKSYSAQQRQMAAEASAANAAALLAALEAQAEERRRLVPPGEAACLAAQGGLPAMAARGSSTAAWARVRAAAQERQRKCQQQADAAGAEIEGKGEAEGGEEVEEGVSVRGMRPVPPQRLEAVNPVLNYVAGKGVPLQAFVLPTADAVPPYKTWTHIARNCVSLDTGNRMFYTDEKGETVPVSDDDADVEQQLDHQALHGIHRLRHDHVIREVTAQFGTRPAVFEALQDRLGISAAALEARAGVLATAAAGLQAPPPQPVWAEKAERLAELEVDMHSSWCRRCHIFGCRLHPGQHSRPVLGPVTEREQKRPGPRGAGEKVQPCGPRCYLQHAAEGATLEPAAVADAPRAGVPATKAGGAAAGKEAVNVVVEQQQLPTREQHQRPREQQKQQEHKGQVPFGSLPGPLASQRTSKRRQGDFQAERQRSQQQREQTPSLRQAKGRARAPEQEVMSPPAKQARLDSSLLADVPRTAAGAGTAAAATAAAANAPARRRRGSGTAGSSRSELGSGGSSRLAPEGPGAPAAAAAAQRNPDDAPWTEWEDGLVQQGIEVWGRDPCKVACLVGSRSCRATHRRMQQQGADAPGGGGEEEAEQQQQRRGQGRKMAKSQVKSRKPPAVYERTKRPTNEMWPQYAPCTCLGACKSDCPCAGDANFCEKYCACDPAKCSNRFPGCTCKCGSNLGKRCSTKQCPCLGAGRECDPDLCKSCKPTLTGVHREGWQCNNFRIRLGQKKRVLMGLSDIQGWGAFLQQPAQKDEYVGEYCGELINHEEADRRGTVYDRDDNSYLFNLNLKWVIDARQKGNTLRFANHSTSANCRAEILMVDGDHRVAIVTNREVREGEELFYNYNYDKRVAPDWAVGMQQAEEAVRGVAKKNAVKRQGARGGSSGGGASDRD